MKSLLTKVETVLSGLSWAAAYDNPAGGTIAMRSYTGAIPHKRNTEAQGEDFPYRLTRLSGFEIARNGMVYTVSTEIGVYTYGDIDDGVTLVDAVLTVVEPLADEMFNPYKLLEEVTGELSENNHPYYTINLDMVFRKVRTR